MQYTLKKSLGQHFLNDAQICKDIQEVLLQQEIKQLLEVGPGAGALTKYIQDIPTASFKAIELDREKVAFLSQIDRLSARAFHLSAPGEHAMALLFGGNASWPYLAKIY